MHPTRWGPVQRKDAFRRAGGAACVSATVVVLALLLLFSYAPESGGGALYDGGRIDLLIVLVAPAGPSALLAWFAGRGVVGWYIAHEEETE